MGAINRNDYLFLGKLNRSEKLLDSSDKHPFRIPVNILSNLIKYKKYYETRFANLSSQTIAQESILYISKPILSLLEKYIEATTSYSDKIVPLKDKTGLILLNNGKSILFQFLNDETKNCVYIEAFEAEYNILISYSLSVYEYSTGNLTCNKFLGFEATTISDKRVGGDLLILFSFLKTISHQTKTINTRNHSKSKEIEQNGEIYVSNSKLPIEIISTGWYNSTIRTLGFNVTGHFRLQPFGIGRTSKKLIWIEKFKKQGYCRKAKMLDNSINV